MPFKTKRQKVAANLRRYMESSTVSVSYAGEVANLDAQKVSREVKETGDVDTFEKLDYVKRDFVKIATTAAVIFAFQLLILLLQDRFI